MSAKSSGWFGPCGPCARDGHTAACPEPVAAGCFDTDGGDA